MSMGKLNDNELENIVGGQLTVDNVMGVKGLNMCTGSPTDKNPEGVFWSFNNISLAKEETMKKLKKESTKSLNEELTSEAFLIKYIQKYNDEVDGQVI